MIRMLMMRLALAMAVMLALPAQAEDIAAARTAVETAMTDSAAGWNGGDLDRFLGIYSDDPATSFTGGKGIARGKASIRQKYIDGYPQVFGPARGAGASSLSFSFEDFRMLGEGHALLIARWRLETPGKEAQTGMTSLIFRREPGGWKIVADHS